MPNLIPPSIFCPKCGKSMRLLEVRDPIEQASVITQGYSQAARGQCPCGVWLAFLTRPLPEDPTFTIKFNIYKKGGE